MADEKRPDEAERVVRREDADDVEGHKVTKVGVDEDDVAGRPRRLHRGACKPRRRGRTSLTGADPY